MPEMITYRSMVEPRDCDFLGHMNVSRYFAACSDAIGTIQAAMGLTASDMRTGRRLSFAVVKADSSFKAELLAGEAIYMTTGIVELGTRSATFRHRLFRVEDDTCAFETAFTCVMLGLESRRAEPIPDAVRAAAAQFMIDPEAAW